MSQTDTGCILPSPQISMGAKIMIARAPYYKDIADDLLAGAQAAIIEAGGKADLIDVPGALELPTAIALAAASGQYDAFVALGCVIRGETTHYDTVCNDSSRGLTLLGLQGVCIGNGILTVEDHKQAVLRADPTGQNKGGHAADAAMHLLALKSRFGAPAPSSHFSPDSEHIQIASAD